MSQCKVARYTSLVQLNYINGREEIERKSFTMLLSKASLNYNYITETFNRATRRNFVSLITQLSVRSDFDSFLIPRCIQRGRTEKNWGSWLIN